jgi:hypothetical protein
VRSRSRYASRKWERAARVGRFEGLDGLAAEQADGRSGMGSPGAVAHRQLSLGSGADRGSLVSPGAVAHLRAPRRSSGLGSDRTGLTRRDCASRGSFAVVGTYIGRGVSPGAVAHRGAPSRSSGLGVGWVVSPGAVAHFGPPSRVAGFSSGWAGLTRRGCALRAPSRSSGRMSAGRFHQARLRTSGLLPGRKDSCRTELSHQARLRTTGLLVVVGSRRTVQLTRRGCASRAPRVGRAGVRLTRHDCASRPPSARRRIGPRTFRVPLLTRRDDTSAPPGLQGRTVGRRLSSGPTRCRPSCADVTGPPEERFTAARPGGRAAAPDGGGRSGRGRPGSSFARSRTAPSSPRTGRR